MKLDITHKLGAPTYNDPSGGIEVKIDDEVVTSITHIDLNLDAQALPEATITYACYEGVTWLGEVNPHHVCPLPARLPPGSPPIEEIRKAVEADIEIPLSYEADTHEIEAYHTLRRLARAHLGLAAEEDR